MQKLTRLTVDLEIKFADVRSIQRRIGSMVFRMLYKDATPEQREEAAAIINKLDREGLQNWIAARRHDGVLLESLPIRELRDRGSRLGIKNYCRCTRDKLIQLIRAHEDAECKHTQ